MKEKIIEILKSHSYHHTEGVGVKSQFKYLAEIAFECCADEIMLALDQSQFTADESEDYINQEVEKRIAERMPSEEDVEINLASFDEITNDWFDFTHVVYHWLRSRLTCSEKSNNSQKTEGGER